MELYWWETKWLLQSSHGKQICKGAQCALKRTSVMEKEDEVQLPKWNAQRIFFSSCSRKQGSGYTRYRRTSMKYGACRYFCYISLLCVVWKGNKKMQHFWISGIPRDRDPFYKHCFCHQKKISKPRKHSLFFKLVPISLYRRQFLSFSNGDS